MVIPGAGLEDFETLERVFSASNALTPITRYASPYRRRLLIDMFFKPWDAEKYANLGMMLYNNYRQALKILDENAVDLANSLVSLGLTLEGIKQLEEDERSCIETIGEEDPWDLHALAYVETLDEYRRVSPSLEDTTSAVFSAVPATYRFMPPESGAAGYGADLSSTRKLETSRRKLAKRKKDLAEEITLMEDKMNIARTWTATDEEYIATHKYIATRQYQRALLKLQRLVVQRLFELTKINLSLTGYRMRTKIAKNLQSRCGAIRTAVAKYNMAAVALVPPCPPLDWSQASKYNFIEEFAILQDTRANLREKPWAQPLVRKVMRLRRRVDGAIAELDTLNREVRHLHTSICDEEHVFAVVLANLKLRGDTLHGALLHMVTRRRGANERNARYLRRVHALRGFTGSREPGQRQGALLPRLPLPALHDDASRAHNSDDEDDDGGDDGDLEDVTRLEEFIGNLD